MLLKRATVLALFLFSSLGHAAVEPLAATPDQAKTTLEMLEKLNTKHYANKPFDDKLSMALLDNYLDLLDIGRIYLLESDIREFKRWSTTLDDSLKQGDLKPGFAIFNRYRERVIDRLNKNIALLESGTKFDFTADEAIDYETEDKPWAKSAAELDEIWRKRIKDSYLRLVLAEKKDDEIPTTLIKRYRNQLKQIEQSDAEDAHQFYMNALTELYDPHTSYFSPRQLENFNISMSLKLEGIGAMLQMEEETTSVVRVIPGGPADKQGILTPQDKIVGVGEGEKGAIEDVIGWRLDDVVDLIRGKKGTTVRLEIVPTKGENAGINQVISIVRDEVKLEEQAAKSRIHEIQQNGKTFKVGVIDLPAFYIDFDAFNKRDPNFKSTTRDVAKLLEELKAQNVDGIILDLRDNGGGSLHEVTTMTDLFIHPGPVVQVRQANQMVSRGYRARNGALYEGPLVVLINRLSASASEIFAGAIQDYRRGLIVGTQTYGKGTVQALVPLHEGQIKLTESKFYRVSGDSTQHRGVIPDIALASVFDLEEIGESSKEHALPWDQIHAVPIKRYDDLSDDVAVLTERHNKRAETDPDYKFLLKEIELNKVRRDQTMVSLSLDKRKAEQESYEKALFDIENQRRTAKGLVAYASIEEWKDKEDLASTDEEQAEQEAQTEAEKEMPLDDDPLLKEASHILVDEIAQPKNAQDDSNLKVVEQVRN